METSPLAICARYDALKMARGSLESHLQEIVDLIFTRRGNFTGAAITEGEKRNSKVIDSTGMRGLGLLAAGLHSYASHPATRWFALRTTDKALNENDAVRKWLGDVEDIIFAKMHSPRSSITNHLHELYLDMGAFGTGVMFIGETDDNALLFQTRFLGECVIDENSEGIVDTLIREFTLSVRQAVQKWGDKCSEETRKKHADGKLDDKVTILHAVYPRGELDPQKKTPDNMPVASIYLEKQSRHELAKGGFEEFPYAVPRWFKAAGDKYGRSPAMEALPEVKMLQEMRKTIIKAAQKIVDPPLLVPDDGMLGPVRTVPGGLNFYRGERQISPLMTGGNIPLGLEMMQDSRDIILKAFYADIMQPTIEKQMTAYEYAKVIEQAMRLLGPVMGRMESELLGVLVSRVFNILTRQGELPEQPEELDGVEFTVEYTSPVASAQRAAKVDQAVSMLQIAGQMAAFDPAIMARFNSEKFLTWMATEMNVDADLIMGDDEFGKKQQQAQMAAMAGPAAQAAQAFAAAGQGAKAFAEAGAVQ